MIHVFDACACLALLRGEPGAEVVESSLQDPEVECLMHSMNLCEVFYIFSRILGESEADRAIADLFAASLKERNDMDATFWRRVGGLKTLGRIALPDCFCVALAERVGGQVLTSDRKEFAPLVPLGICPILFIR